MAVNSAVTRENKNDSSSSAGEEPHVPSFPWGLALLVLKIMNRFPLLPTKLLSYKYDSGMQVNQLRVTSSENKTKCSTWLEFKFCHCPLHVT